MAELTWKEKFTRWIRFLCIATSILFYGSGISSCIRMYQNGNTHGVSVLPFMTGAFSAGLWINYAIFTKNGLTIVTSSIGLIFYCIYTVIYYHYAEEKLLVANLTVLLVITLLTVIVYTWFFLSRNEGQYRAGLYANVVCLILMATPFIQLREMHLTKSVENVPVVMITIGFILSILFTIYGILEEDFYVVICSGISSVITAVELSVYHAFARS